MIMLVWGLSLSYRVAFVSPPVAIALEKHHLYLRFWRVSSVPRTTAVLQPSRDLPAHQRWWPYGDLKNKGIILIIPLWTVFILAAAPTALLWWRDRRTILPGHCRKCGYDLTGNASGVCPECGISVPSANSPSVPPGG